MTAYAATAVYECDCGAQTHVFMESDGKPSRAHMKAVFCWKCGEVTGIAPAARVWSSSTAQGARRLRLMGLNDGIGQAPRNPADYRNTQSPAWDVL
jgi:hypothetical protein